MPDDDARHITWDFGRRTLCGQAVKGDPGDFYLPLGKAPHHDEGGAWCWSCLQLQDEVLAARPSVQQREPTDEEIEAAAKAVHSSPLPGLSAYSWDEATANTRRLYMDAARAALCAARKAGR